MAARFLRVRVSVAFADRHRFGRLRLGFALPDLPNLR